MAFLDYQILPDSLLLHAAKGTIQLIPYTPGCIRIRYTLKPGFGVRESWMVQKPPAGAVPFTVEESPAGLRFSTAAVVIEINSKTAAFTYRDTSGALLTREPETGGKILDPVEVQINQFDPATRTRVEQGADGIKVRAQAVQGVIKKPAYAARLAFEWAEGEALYGLGSHEEGMFNLRGQHQYLYQQNMKVALPVLVSTRGYGILLDHYSLMTFHDDAFGSYLWTECTDELDYYFLYGPEFDQIIHQMRRLTGGSPLLPRWAFGYFQSKERYVSQEELVQIVEEYRARQLPIDCVVLDWQSWPGKLWGQKTLDAARFPDPAQMMARLHALNARLMISIWPNLSAGGTNWQEMSTRGFLLGNQSTYDAFNPQATDLYWKQTNEGLFAHGIDAWWCDCTEPFEADWRGAVKPEPEERLRINTTESKFYLDPAHINAYSLLHSQGIYAGQRASGSDKRVLILTRSGYIGQQRYATVVWSGDVTATWETLRKQIAAGLNYCVTGMPYWTVDIGAFFVKNRPDLWFWRGDYDLGVADLGYRELYLRWFQFAAFLPMFRSHGTDTPREIWRFGEPGEPIYDSLKKFLELRYRLLPYIYSLAGWTTHRDYTMLRALPFDFRGDPQTYACADQFMFGPALLVNPVTQPMCYTAGSQPLENVPQTRPVYLPAGCDWYDFWTEERYPGGQTLQAAAPLDRLPLFVRGGSILPFGPPRQFSEDLPGAPLELRIYPGQDGEFTLYEDEGDGYRYEEGAYATISLHWDDAGRCLVLEERRGAYPGMPVARQFQITLRGENRPPQPLPGAAPKVITYQGERIVIYFNP